LFTVIIVIGKGGKKRVGHPVGVMIPHTVNSDHRPRNQQECNSEIVFPLPSSCSHSHTHTNTHALSLLPPHPPQICAKARAHVRARAYSRTHRGMTGIGAENSCRKTILPLPSSPLPELPSPPPPLPPPLPPELCISALSIE
jgi:hypothetical protein